MSGIVDRVREKVRSRSRPRKSISDEPVDSGHGYHGADSRGRTSQDVGDRRSTGVSSTTSSTAWHVHKGARNSSEIGQAPPVPPIDNRFKSDNQHPQDSTYLPPTRTSNGSHFNIDSGPTMSEGRTPNYSHRHTQSSDLNQDPSRGLSLQDHTPRHERSSSGNQNVQYPYTVPRRKESLQHNRDSRGSFEQKRRQNRMSLEHKNEQSSPAGAQAAGQAPVTYAGTRGRLPDQPVSPSLGAEIDEALASLSINEQNKRRADQAGQTRATIQPAPETIEHLRLPPGFDVGHRERTVIDTKWRPAVTHEDVYHEKTEIVQEAISRDIHVHHYYTYVQPIKVLEVLPAKHYRIDEKSGLKVEIPAPEGWVMPHHLQPRKEDASGVKGWSRHYLVNDKYPKGILESPPPTQSLDGTAHGVRPFSHGRV